MSPARALWLRVNTDRVRAYKRKCGKKLYAANPEKFSNRQSKWRRDNQERVRKRDAWYRLKYADKRPAQFKSWRVRNREYFRQRGKQDVINLANWYVREKLSDRTSIKPSEWPASMVELMRVKMQINRHLWHNQKT